MEFQVKTTDDVYTYTSTSRTASFRFEIQTNNKTADTQGYLRKIQKGASRVRAIVDHEFSQNDYENTMIPMLTYPSNVRLSADRNIPGTNSTGAEFTFESMKIVRELEGPEYGIEMTFVEVLS